MTKQPAPTWVPFTSEQARFLLGDETERKARIAAYERAMGPAINPKLVKRKGLK